MAEDTAEDAAILNDPNRGYHDMEGKPISLRAAMALKHEKSGGKGIVVVAEDTVGDKTVRSVWLGDTFEDELLPEDQRPKIARVYGTAVCTENPFKLVAEFRSNHLQVHERHKEIVEALRQGPEAYEAVRLKHEQDQIT